MTS
ncbi:hypothetical protein MIMGU_mgv1a0020251mg, partial [Erythranthe guttata]|jgi:hypothetical protein